MMQVTEFYDDTEVGREIIGLMLYSKKLAVFIAEHCYPEDFSNDKQRAIFEAARKKLRAGDWFSLDSLGRELGPIDGASDCILELAEAGRYGCSDILLPENFNELKKRKLQRMKAQWLYNDMPAEEIRYGIEKIMREMIHGTLDDTTDTHKVIAAYNGESGDIFLPGWLNLNQILKFETGMLSVLTGVPSHGKTTFLNCLIINLVRRYGIGVACISPEMKSANYHMADLIKCKTRSAKLKDAEIEREKKEMEKLVQIIELPEERRTTEAILGSLRENIKFLIIDPWNEIEATQPKDINKTDFIGIQLKRIKSEARERNIHVLICAHPAKPQHDKAGKRAETTLYSIADSAHWANKPDLGFRIVRDKELNITTLTTLKVRYSGRNGIQDRSVNFRYRDFQFEEILEDEENEKIEFWHQD